MQNRAAVVEKLGSSSDRHTGILCDTISHLSVRPETDAPVCTAVVSSQEAEAPSVRGQTNAQTWPDERPDVAQVRLVSLSFTVLCFTDTALLLLLLFF